MILDQRNPLLVCLKGKMRVLARISSCVIKWGPGNDVSFVEGPDEIIAHLVLFFTYKMNF